MFTFGNVLFGVKFKARFHIHGNYKVSEKLGIYLISYKTKYCIESIDFVLISCWMISECDQGIAVFIWYICSSYTHTTKLYQVRQVVFFSLKTMRAHQMYFGPVFFSLQPPNDL